MPDDADRAAAAMQRLSLAAVQSANLKPVRPGGTCRFQGAVYEVLSIIDGRQVDLRCIGR